MKRPKHPRRRPGFTLVELLVVMVVIGVLIALLLPAIGGAMKSAQAARVTAEISNMATALAQFKSTYSDYPPSRIMLCESGVYPTTATSTLSAPSPGQGDINAGQLAQRSVRYLTKFFPRAVCFTTITPTPATLSQVDINGDGTINTQTPFYLDGGECLVFFLGGQPTIPITTAPANTPIGMSGFSRNPSNPFLFSVATANFPASTSRTQPFYEFSGSRLHDIDGDGFPSYFDALSSGTQGRPYAYFSAYGTNSYDPNDMNLNAGDIVGESLEGNGGNPFSRVFAVNFPVQPAISGSPYPAGMSGNLCVSPTPNPYTNSYPVLSTTTNPAPIPGPVTWQNPNSFQIISAGSDQRFGVGGQFAGNNPTQRLGIATFELGSPAGPWPTQWSGGIPGGTPIDDSRNMEADNLSNFVSSRLNQ